MALGTPSESPAVVVREIDLTGGVPNVQSTTGAIVGNFKWGPMNEAIPVSNETELVNIYSSPDTTNNIDFLSATQFLRYSSSLQAVRVGNDSAGNTPLNSIVLSTGLALDSTSELADGLLILNRSDFESREDGITALNDSITGDNFLFAGKYAGELGNSLRVSYVGCLDSTDSSTFDNWLYKAGFDRKPTTTSYATKFGATSDEIHVAIVDNDGLLSGSKGTVLETFPSLSVIKGAKADDGSSLYVKDVINTSSVYAWMINFDSDLTAVGAGETVVDAKNYSHGVSDSDTTKKTFDFTDGSDGAAIDVGDYVRGFDYFSDRDQIEVDFLIAPGLQTAEDQTTITNHITSIASSTRKDCVAVSSPNRAALIGVTLDLDKVANTITTVDTFTKSSYLIVDNNYVKVYDKYNDKYVLVPAASSTAGIMASTDFNRAPWFSPAGSRRGQLLGVTGIHYSPTKGQRDALYKAGVNPIANIAGQGTVLFGDKTFLGRPSAFDRINVRRLFLVLERAIGRAAEQALFEFNDEFTRAEFVNIVEPVLREVQGRRGITDFRVVCDETNNTTAVIDRNEFKADIFIKPARSINYVTLNFVAVRTGVDFEEVVGTV